MKKISIEICHGKTCSNYYPSLLKKSIKRLEQESIELIDCGCMGQCQKAPNVRFNGQVLNSVSLQDIKQIVDKKL